MVFQKLAAADIMEKIYFKEFWLTLISTMYDKLKSCG